MKASVLIIQEHMPAFRVGFYEILRKKLAAEGVSLGLIYAPNQRNTFVRRDVDWAIPVPIRWFGKRVGWQPVLKYCLSADLVVIQQETKYLVNPILQLWSKFGGPKIAYWGHGKNFQSINPNSLEERIKRWLSKRVDWWFAYNRLSALAVRAMGFPSERITEVMNSIDTKIIRNARAQTSAETLEKLKGDLGIDSSHVAVYTGGLYALKRIDFLLAAADIIRSIIPDFHLIVIGHGPDFGLVQQASMTRSWIHSTGPKSDIEKVPYWMLSSILMMPGGVGLVALDSLALGVPMVTTNNRLHGPEIDYLSNGENALIVDCGDDVNAYAEEVARLLKNQKELERLTRNAELDAASYSFENMSDNFANGVLRCLGKH